MSEKEQFQDKIKRLEYALMISERNAEVLGNMLKETVREYESSLNELRIAKLTEEALSRSNKELELFAYVVSHDLQAPLRTISGFLQLLRERHQAHIDGEGGYFIERCQRAAHRMQTLIEGLLSLARVKTRGKRFESTDLNHLVKDVLENLHSAIHERMACIRIASLPELMLDSFQMQRLFQNLILNALKYNESSTPVIEIGCHEDGHAYQIFVKDNGIGIPPQFHNAIFTVFRRLHKDEQYPGAGLGLALCKQIVERHGGTIWVDSRPNEGATFYFTLLKGCQIEPV